MKEATVHSLLIGKTLLDQAIPLCSSVDRYKASAGLSILQDAIEIFFIALLIELGVDEQKALESKSFDELVGELKKAGVPVPKSGTLKALNKQRVLTKHYAQVADSTTVKGYLDAAVVAIDASLLYVTEKSLSGILLTEILDECEAKDFLMQAGRLIERGNFLPGLVEIRKAFYVFFEFDYDIQGWRDVEDQTHRPGLADILRGGRKSPCWARNRKWIEENVKKPAHYILIDHEQWRVDAMEKEISAVELHNLRRLTPAVIRDQSSGAWLIEYDVHYEINNANDGNARYCLDRAIVAISKAQEHKKSHRRVKRGSFGIWPEFFLGDSVYAKASTATSVVHVVNEKYNYNFGLILTGFSGADKFVEISGYLKNEPGQHLVEESWVSGFLILREDKLPS